MKKVIIWIPLAFLLLGQAIFADDVTVGTGNELSTYCNSKNAGSQNDLWLVCVAYVNGVIGGNDYSTEVVQLLGNPNDPNGVVKTYKKLAGLCIPNNVSRNQMALVVAKALSEHPETLNQPSQILVIDAIHAMWGCK